MIDVNGVACQVESLADMRAGVPVVPANIDHCLLGARRRFKGLVQDPALKQGYLASLWPTVSPSTGRAGLQV